MAYGVKRGVKAPGEFSAVDIFGLSIAGAAGIVAALVTDYQQKGEASALYTINQWVVALARMAGLGDIPLWLVIVGLVVIGAGSIFYFQPITRQGAFAQGFGLFAVMMTAVPAQLGGALQPHNALEDLDLAAASGVLEAKIHNASAIAPAFSKAAARPGEARVYTVQATRGAAKYDVRLTIAFPKGVPDDIDTMIRQGAVRGRLHNSDTKTTYNLFRSSGGSVDRTADGLIIRAGVPARSDNATLWVRVEVEGYAIEEQSAAARLGETLDWRITMQPSSTPLFLQRLGKSYWF
ncbi:MAG: hypothetical protein AB7P23_10245 [Amphiplicatus sp.]